MSLHVLILVLTAAFLHAFWNLLSKKAQGKAPFVWLVFAFSSIVYLPVLLFQKSFGHITFSQPLLWLSISSAVFHVGYYIVLQKGYRSADLSVVYPLARGTGPLFSSIAAILFLHEALRLNTTIGLFLIVGGVFIITGLSFKWENNREITTGIGYGVSTGFLIALYTFNDTIAVKSFALSPLTLTMATNMFAAILLLPFVLSKKVELKREIIQHKWIIIAIAVLSPAAYILVLESLKYAPLTVVAPARETSILLGVFMGSRIFSEKNVKRRLLGSLLILGGIVLLI